MRWPVLLLASIVSALGGAALGQEPASVNPLAALNLESLAATRTLPLFTPSRQPPPPAPEVKETEPVAEAPEAPPPPELPPVELVGVVMTGTTQFALLRDRDSGDIIRLGEDEDYDGWAITIVDPRTVELRTGDQVETLTMFQEFTDGEYYEGDETTYDPDEDFDDPDPNLTRRSGQRGSNDR